MKKLLTYMLCTAVVFAACKKNNDRIFDKSADERLRDALNAYQQQLQGAAFGWKAIIEPVGGGAYGFYFKFSDTNRVRMYSDFNLTSAGTVKESSYRLKALQQPSLLFDTYSYVHLLADPDPTVNGGTRGQGLRSDFEFYFASSSTDTIRLVGRFNGSKATLIRATQQDATNYTTGLLVNSLLFSNIRLYQNYFKRVTIAGKVYDIKVDQVARTISLSWLDGSGNVQTFTTGYYYDIGGVYFTTPFTGNSQNITSLTNITWNAGTTTLGFTANGNATTVVGTGQPIKIDLTAPSRWWNLAADNGTYWYSLDGFHVNGVDDAFAVNSITSGTSVFYYYIFFPEFYTNPYDLFCPALLTTANSIALSAYRPVTASPPVFTSDGRIIFTYLGNAAATAIPANGPAAKSNTQIGIASGYYLVQTGQFSYDMVSALDGKAWISWEL